MLDRGITASAIKNVSMTYVPRDMSLCLFLSRSGCPKLLTIDNKCRRPVLSLQPFPARSQEQRPVHASRRYPACNGRAPICPKIKRIRAAGRMPRPLAQCTKRCKAFAVRGAAPKRLRARNFSDRGERGCQPFGEDHMGANFGIAGMDWQVAKTGQSRPARIPERSLAAKLARFCIQWPPLGGHGCGDNRNA